MKKFLHALSATVILTACTHNGASITGHASGSNKRTVYLDKIGFAQTLCVDSTTTDKNGDFRFRLSGKSDSPNFYRLRIGQNEVIVPIDSTEDVNLSIDTEGKVSYTNSPNAETLHSLPQKSKKEVEKTIFSNPSSAITVYALLLKDGNEPMFDMNDKRDAQFYAMVATAYNKKYPQSEYTQWLCALIYNKGNEKMAQQNLIKSLMNSKERGYFDIALPDVDGNVRKLSDFDGKEMLLVFSYFSSDYYDEEKLALEQLHKEHPDVVIYSVSLDANYELWHANASRLPWTCVHDKNALHSVLLSTYNINTLPTYFVVSPQGDITSRCEKIAALQNLTFSN